MNSEKDQFKLLTIRLKVKEYERLKERFANTTCRSLNRYARNVLSNAPVKVFFRNKSFDEFVEEAILLRKEMQLIREHLPFTKDSENRLVELHLEIKESINKLADYVSKYKT
jgi:hypothetical protein